MTKELTPSYCTMRTNILVETRPNLLRVVSKAPKLNNNNNISCRLRVEYIGMSRAESSRSSSLELTRARAHKRASHHVALYMPIWLGFWARVRVFFGF